MPGRRIGLTILALSALGAGPAFAAGDVALFLGQKQINDDLLDPIEDSPELGMVLTTGGREWPVLMAVDFFYAKNDEDKGPLNIELETFELDAGVRKFWLKRFRPFVGGGLAIIKGTYTRGVVLIGSDADDQAIGFWADGGFLWNVTEKLGLGLDVRYSSASGDIYGESTDLGGTHFGFLLGWGL